MIYSVLSAFSSSAVFTSTGIEPGTGSLAKFNSITGEWQIFLGMSIIMEFVVVGIYIAFGISLPLNKEEDAVAAGTATPMDAYGAKEYEYGNGYTQKPYASSIQSS